MLNTKIKTLMTGVAAATLMATGAIAQTAEVVTPDNTVVVPEAALEAQASEGFVVETDYPMLESVENNEMVAETLIAQGYTDVVISREGPILTVNAQRAGTPIELVYSTANGRLISVDGVETREDPNTTSANDESPAESFATEGMDGVGTDDDMTDDDGMTDGDDATDDDATDDATDDSTDGADDGMDGSDDGADTDGSDSDGADTDGSDSGSDSDNGGDSDSGGDSGSDGGSDGGSDSDGGDSNS